MKGGVVVVMFLLLLVVEASSSISTPTLQAAAAGAKDQAQLLELQLYGDDDQRPELSLSGITSGTYRDFLARVRDLLGTTQVLGFQVLRSRASMPQWSARLVMVDITNFAGETATLVLDVTNVYVVGYAVGNVSVFIMPDAQDVDMRDAIAGGYRFPGTTESRTLPFTGGYDALQRAASLDREEIPLGTEALDRSVTSMRLYALRPTPTILNSVARALIVCIQMVSEAARFPYIESEMRRRIRLREDTEPDASVTHIENTWSELSQAIQTSDNNGVFANSVLLQRRDYSRFPVYDVQTIAPYIAILLFYCTRVDPSPRSSWELHPPVPVRPEPVAVIRLPVKSEPEPEPECPANVEPKVRILGADGLCVDVRDGAYNNGNPIQLWPCHSNDAENQLWTFHTDGTLRSNGKCMASYGDTPLDYIMIYDCEPGVRKFTWRSWTNGTITSGSGLRLSTYSSVKGTTLSARDEARNPGQSWLPTNQTQPSVNQIAGISGLCLHAADDDGVLLRECATMQQASLWALYPDGSIRPDGRRSTCLAPPDAQPGTPLVTVSCNPNRALQRWLFSNDGAIVNLDDGFVMDVQGGSAVPGARLTLNPFVGTSDNQVWQALL